jgi:hypothetical protein
VTFTGPGGQVYDVPGFFDGDGSGGKTGNVWRVRFTPDEAGTWSYQASFRKGANVAVDLDPTAGIAKGLDGASGTFDVAERDATAPGFLKFGRLEYAGEHYLKFRDGPYWLKGGANSPENLLGYAGFDNTPQAQHTFSPHAGDWQTSDPIFNTSSADEGKGLIGAMNYLSSQEVNSIYFLPMNIGGDGEDTSPYVGPINWAGSPSNDNLHFDVSKLGQWESAFAHAQKKGIHLHFVLNEAEEANKRELDDGTLGVERKLFYREMVARYGHHLALQWNLSEEYDHLYPLSPETLKEFAWYIQQQDPYNHPITVHQLADPETTWTPFLGDERFSLTSFQYPGRYAGHGDEVEEWRRKTASAGRPIPISMDELETATQDNADQQRMRILWPTYLSGGQLGWYIKEEDRTLEDFRRYTELWTYTRHARSFVEENLPFWEMASKDELLSGESTDYSGGQVFAKAGEIYAVYLPNATSTGVLDLSGVSGSFKKRWYNPRTGSFEGVTEMVSGGDALSLGQPPSSPSEDWVVLLEGSSSVPPEENPTDQSLIGFSLIDADTDQPIMPLANGATLDLTALPTKNLNIRAETDPTRVGSVRFSLDGTYDRDRIENSPPYALMGDVRLDYRSWTPSVGSYQLTATPYTASDGSGTRGTPLTISFNVTQSVTEIVEPVAQPIAGIAEPVSDQG